MGSAVSAPGQPLEDHQRGWLFIAGRAVLVDLCRISAWALIGLFGVKSCGVSTTVSGCDSHGRVRRFNSQ